MSILSVEVSVNKPIFLYTGIYIYSHDIGLYYWFHLNPEPDIGIFGKPRPYARFRILGQPHVVEK